MDAQLAAVEEGSFAEGIGQKNPDWASEMRSSWVGQFLDPIPPFHSGTSGTFFFCAEKF